MRERGEDENLERKSYCDGWEWVLSFCVMAAGRNFFEETTFYLSLMYLTVPRTRN